MILNKKNVFLSNQIMFWQQRDLFITSQQFDTQTLFDLFTHILSEAESENRGLQRK